MEKITAKRGERTIKVTVDLWTDKIASRVRGEIMPGHAWRYGVVNVRANHAHGIKSTVHPFNCFEDLPKVIEKALKNQGVVLHDIKKKSEAK
jgi:hypothetical protein